MDADGDNDTEPLGANTTICSSARQENTVVRLVIPSLNATQSIRSVADQEPGLFLEGYFAKQTFSAVVQRICLPHAVKQVVHIFSYKALRNPKTPTPQVLCKVVRRKPTNVQAAFPPQQTTLTTSKASIPVSNSPSLLSICLSISPACFESRVIVTLTQGSVRQPEDLLLQIETRHLSDASCLLPPISILALPAGSQGAQYKFILNYVLK